MNYSGWCKVSDDLAILIPFAGTCEDRLANLAAIQAWYAARFAGVAQIVAGDGGCRAGWTKAYAVERAMAQTDARVLIVADADCLCEGVVPAAQAVVDGLARWAFPHTQIRRLTLAATTEVRSGTAPHLGMAVEHPPYAGVAGGGICVVTREAYGEAPMDPRFKVTHGEDVAWARGLAYLCGRPWYPRDNSPLYHLWHPPILAVGARFRHNQSIAGEYSDATSLTIREVIARGRAHRDRPPVPKIPSNATIAVVVPVLHRPAAAAPFVASWAASGAARSRVYAVTDLDDCKTWAAWKHAGATVLIGDRGHTFAQKANYAYEATEEPWLLLVGDDVRFHPGWDTAALAAGQLAPVVSTNDMARDDLDHLAVHPMIHRRYITERGASFDGPGLVAHEGYRHWYVDREWSFLARERGALIYAPGARIEHLHPIFGTAEMDDTYRLGQAAAADDARTYNIRVSQYNARIKRSTSA